MTQTTGHHTDQYLMVRRWIEVHVMDLVASRRLEQDRGPRFHRNPLEASVHETLARCATMGSEQGRRILAVIRESAVENKELPRQIHASSLARNTQTRPMSFSESPTRPSGML